MIKKCPECGYEETKNGCETPGCLRSIWMTEEVRQRILREQAEQKERERISEIRSRYGYY